MKNTTQLQKFLVTLIFAFSLVFGAIWYWVAVHPMAFLDSEYPVAKAKTDMVRDCKIPELVVFGDSKPMVSVLPENMKVNTLNLGVGAGKIATAVSFGEQVLACPILPKAVILSISYGSFSAMQVGLWEHDVKFNAPEMTVQKLEELRTEARQYADIETFGSTTPLDIDARLKILLYSYRFPSYYTNSLLGGRFTQRRQENESIYAAVVASRGYHMYSNVQGNWETNGFLVSDHFYPSEYQIALAEKFISMFESRHIPVYYFSPPYKQSDLLLLKPTMREDNKRFLNYLETRHKNFHVLNDYFPSLPNEQFGDVHHVNRSGAEAWTAHLSDLLEKQHIP